MLPIRIGLASRSASVDSAAVKKAADAINVQVVRDFGPIWNVNATIVSLDDPNSVPPGVWPIFIVDQVDGDYAGIHLTNNNQPFANVLAGQTWSLTASHECLEMLADPSGNRLISSTSVVVVDNEVRDGEEKFEYLVEICDASEDDSCAYLIDDVLVSDFYTPRFFDTVGAIAVRYSFGGKVTRPREVLPNGYLSWYNPIARKLQQVRAFGSPVIVDLPGGDPRTGSLTGGLPLRAFVDRQTRAPIRLSDLRLSSPILERRSGRAAYLAAASPERGALYIAAAQLSRPIIVPALAAIGKPQKIDASVIAQVAKPGVVSVRSGWEFASGWITERSAVVVTAQADKVASLTSSLPKFIGDAVVQVRAATATQQLRAEQPQNYAIMAEARHELRNPEFADEVYFDAAGKPVAPPQPDALLAAARPPKPQMPYSAPADAQLDAITDDFSLLLHASPDAGWAKLSEFLDSVRQELVVGMYDFTSAHVLKAVEDMLDRDISMTLTLDHPAKNPSADQTDEETQAALQTNRTGHFEGAWALTRSDPKATAWIYPNAYHIKLAVKDSGEIWLSSGNWNNSNQPEIDLNDPVAARPIATKSDRDWHVIAVNEKMAQTFKAYLENDYTTANRYNASLATSAFAAANAGGPLPDVTMVDVPADVFAAGRSPRQFFQPRTVSGHFVVQPLLTPDNYHPHVLALIQSAQLKFYMQTQYIHPSDKAGDEDHAALIAAVQARIEAGVDVRLITSEFQTADWIEKLRDAGVDVSHLRIQPKVHNKGIVVDGNVVMVSSQNWSADGTLRNRDAGLIIRSAEAAAYFETIFLHDWNILAAARLPT